MKAALLHKPFEPLVLEEVELEDPGPGEVKVKLVATGVCQTDLHPMEGQMRWPLPAVLGHEGAGVIEAVGPGVRSVTRGDHVVLTVLASCGTCPSCVGGFPYLCSAGFRSFFKGTLVSGAKRLHKNGQKLNHFFCQSSFAEYAVVDERTAVKVRSDAPLDIICLLACGAMTGIGGVVNTAGVKPGASVAVFGCGGVGLSAIMGAKLVSASKIIAVDILDQKLAMARDLGATHTINASHGDPVQAVREITDNGVDYAFEAIGRPSVMEQAYAAIRNGGKAVVLGASAPGDVMSIDPYELIAGKALSGSPCGSAVPNIDIPRFVELYMKGQLPLDRLVSHTYSIDRINDAFNGMKTGDAIRSVIVF